MTKNVSLLVLIACLFLTLVSPNPVQAQGKLTILDSSAQAEFPSKLSFSLSVQSDVNITDIRLCYIVDRVNFAEVMSEVYIEFVPSTRVDVSWTLEMVRIGGLPPGSNVEYWWVAKDASGDKVETPPTKVQFADNRYPWRSLTEGKITIYWHDGDESFAHELMAAAHQTLDRLATNTGAHLEQPAKLYIYAGTQDLVGALIYPQEWTGGVAFTRFSIIAIGISPTNLSWGKRAIAHELAHLVIHQITLNPYGDLPNWLDEGLAMYAEGIPSPEYTSRLHRAVAEGNLISVRSLSSPFSAFAEEAILSYAESYSLVEFLIHQYGQSKMLELLNTFRQGSGYDGALDKVFGFDTDGLDVLWRDYVTEKYQLTEDKGTRQALNAVLGVLAIRLPLGLSPASRYRIRGPGQ